MGAGIGTLALSDRGCGSPRGSPAKPQVARPRPRFSAPTPSKKVGGGWIDEINNENAHLAMYWISLFTADNAAKSRGQFGSCTVHSGRTVMPSVRCLKGQWEKID